MAKFCTLGMAPHGVTRRPSMSARRKTLSFFYSTRHPDTPLSPPPDREGVHMMFAKSFTGSTSNYFGVITMLRTVRDTDVHTV
jgi:hypothetical protein